MFELLTLANREDYFKPLPARAASGVFFARFIGYDDDVMVFFRRFQEAADKGGAYIHRGLQNPTGPQVSAFSQAADPHQYRTDRSYVGGAVTGWLPALSPKQSAIFADAVYELLVQLERGGSSDNILKNAFVKFMCWAKYSFETALRGIGGQNPPKILYEGDISKYETYMLRILCRAGCDVLYLHFDNESSYLQWDPVSVYSKPVYSQRRGAPATHFSTIDLAGVEQARKVRRQAENARELVITNTWMTGDFLENIFKTATGRGPSGELYYNLFGRQLGCGDRDGYLTELYRFKMRLEDEGRTVVLQEGSIPNPTLDEVKAAEIADRLNRESIIAGLAARIQGAKNDPLTEVVRGALVRSLQRDGQETPSRLYNRGVKLLCWLRRYRERLFGDFQRQKPPVFLYYGRCGEGEAEFLNLLAATPADVVFLCPDKRAGRVFAVLGEQDRGVEQVLEQTSEEIFPFPRSEPRLLATTAAYSAQKELDQILYSETGLFRHKQFTRCNPVTLKTTYDEIELYWRQEAKYRPNFEAGGGRVVVPNIFAKVCGVKDGDMNRYYMNINRLLTPRTILIKEVPSITASTPNPVKGHAHKFFKNGEIIPDAIKRDPGYRYDHLSDPLQDFILEKIQRIIQWGVIQTHTMGVEYAVIETLLNLDRRALRLIQEFDFTREVPKVVVIDVDESMMSLEDCIYLAFLNLAGFDILVFTPTGYRNVEKYISRESFEEYQIGQYCFNVNVPNLQVPSGDTREGGLLNRLLGKG